MYDRLAKFYDWEHRGFQEDLPMYAGFARAAPGAVLDAACGSGRVLAPLAEAGYRVVGVDSSTAMLALARARVQGLAGAGRVRLVHADLREMDLGERYGMALVALGSFHHLLETVGQQRALSRLAAHLLPGGLLILDLVNPTPEWLAAGDGALVLQRSGPFPGPEGPDLLDKLVARTTDFETQRERLLLIYDRITRGGLLRRHRFEMETRLLFRYEAELLLAGAGFRPRDLYGGYDLEPYQAGSPRMIFVAERP